MENKEELLNKKTDEETGEEFVEENKKTSFPVGMAIFIGIVILLMVACIILLFAFGGPVNNG